MFMEENKQEQLRLIDKLLDPNLPTEEAKKLRALLRQKEKERTEARGLVYIYSSTSGRNESINLTKDLYFQFRKKGKVDQEIAQIIGFSASAVSKWKKRNGIVTRKHPKKKRKHKKSRVAPAKSSLLL